MSSPCRQAFSNLGNSFTAGFKSRPGEGKVQWKGKVIELNKQWQKKSSLDRK